jgi:flagellar hook protein FlgE
MGLFNGFYTSLSGLNSNSHTINVTGNNIANVNTTGFKSSRAEFETQVSQSLRSGSAPSGEMGGTNPTQVGLGVSLAGVSRDFGDGSLQLTGVNTDMAVEGNGFYIVDINGETRYTRAGNFQRNRDSLLTTANGGRVQGYGVDADFNVVEGVLQDISMPIGSLTLAEATGEVKFSGNLNAGGAIATTGTHIESSAMFSDAGATAPAVAGDTLAGLYNAGGMSLFSTGDVIHFTDMTRGGATVPDKSFEVAATNTTASDANGTTVQDLLDFLQDVLGINPAISGGVTLDASGRINVEGHSGELNDLTILGSGVYVNDPAGVQPFSFNKTTTADGESVRTTLIGYDSLGKELSVDVTLVLDSTSNVGTTWRFYAQSEDDTDLATALGSGTLTFGTNGDLLGVTDATITIDHDGTGADTPHQITLNFDDPNLGLSALADSDSQLAAISQDGSPIGTLQDFTVQTNGTIVGEFSNGLLRNLGRVVLATFVNPQGLVETSANQFQATPSSGSASVTTPGSGSAGRIIGEALELSNVDITEQFITLVTASTGFSANSRVFSTSDRLLQELLSIVR